VGSSAEAQRNAIASAIGMLNAGMTRHRCQLRGRGRAAPQSEVVSGQADTLHKRSCRMDLAPSVSQAWGPVCRTAPTPLPGSLQLSIGATLPLCMTACQALISGFSVSAVICLYVNLAIVHALIRRIRARCTGLRKISRKDALIIMGENVKNTSNHPSRILPWYWV
jgi:hypothetical protein